MLTSQISRISSDYVNRNNPAGLTNDLKQPFKIIVDTGAPNENIGTYGDYYIESDTGDFFHKNFNGEWVQVYNFDTGGGGGGGINNLENLGDEGEGIFAGLIGTTATLKSLLPTAGSIDITPSDDYLIFDINSSYVPPILSRFVGSGKISSEAFSPPATADELNGYRVGDIWTQIGPNGPLYICRDNTNGAAVWQRVAPYSVSEVGQITGPTAIKSLTSGGNFEFRRIVGVTDKIVVSTELDNLIIDIDNSFKPATLDLVDNVKNTYSGVGPGPTVNDDSSKGYQPGSIYTSTSLFPEGGHIYVCGSATVGNALWYDISNAPSTAQKDYIQFKIGPTVNYTVSLPGTPTFERLPLGVDEPIIEASKSGTLFSAISVGGGQWEFRRNAIPVALVVGKRGYRVSYSVIYSTGPSSDIREIETVFYKVSGGIRSAVSLSTNTLYPNTGTSRNGQLSASFIFEESSNSAEDYYLQIRGTAGSISISEWALSFQEI